MAMLANGPRGQIVQKMLFDEVLGEIIGDPPPGLPEPLDGDVPNPDRYLGTYGLNGLRMGVSYGETGLEISIQPVNAPVSMRQPAHSRLEPIGDHRFLLRLPDRPTPGVVRFIGDGPRAEGISFGFRLHRRLADGET
jgi:hypothetical protein